MVHCLPQTGAPDQSVCCQDVSVGAGVSDDETWMIKRVGNK